MAKIELFSGQGGLDVVFDVQTGELVTYDGGEGFHDRFGGRTYYQSRSGISHGGWIPANPAVVKVAGYRVDTRRLTDLETTDWKGIPAIFGRQFMVPFDYQGNDEGDYPIVVTDSYQDSWQVALIASHELRAFLLGEVELTEQEFSWLVFSNPKQEEPEAYTVKVAISRYVPRKHLRRVLEAMEFDSLQFNPGEVPLPSRGDGENFWSRMGLYPFGDQADSLVFKITGGIARARYTRAQLADSTVLQAAAPSVYIIDGERILAEDTDFNNPRKRVWLYRRADNGMTELPPMEALRILAGGSTDLADFLAKTDTQYDWARDVAIRLYQEEDIETARAVLMMASWSVSPEEAVEAGVAEDIRYRWSRYEFGNRGYTSSSVLRDIDDPTVRHVFRLAAERWQRDQEESAAAEASRQAHGELAEWEKELLD